MFEFFRRYQRIIYFVITGVIILSFSFFGTYSAFTSRKGDDPVVFIREDGTKMSRSEYTDYVHFLSSDALNFTESGGNLLNNGVIARDIIASGIGEIIAKTYQKDLEEKWFLQRGKEKLFRPYRHPQAPFISAQQAWSYFAPDIKSLLDDLQMSTTLDFTDLYKKKAALYLAERSFPSQFLRQVLRYQQQQFNWLEPDMSLESRHLGLFGYQQMSDWFGTEFIDKTCEFIMNTACEARKNGFSVSTSEALSSLYQNIIQASSQIKGLQEKDPDELFKQALRSLGMDQARAVKVWSDVMLFQQALINLPRYVVVSKIPFQEMAEKASISREVLCFEMQPVLRLKSLRDLEKLELWLQAVSLNPQTKKPSLYFPEKFSPSEHVVTSFPEFVERRFLLSVKELNKDELMKKIRLKEIWNWEVQDKNWAYLTKEIPSLLDTSSTCQKQEERLSALDGLTPQLRAKADAIATKAIMADHPEWIKDALDKEEFKTMNIGVRLQGDGMGFPGIEDRASFIKELAKAPIGDEAPSLTAYTQDNEHFYTIQVLDRRAKDTLVPFPDLSQDGTLDRVLDKLLESSYSRLRGQSPEDFKTEKGEWKPFSEAKEKLGELYFHPLMKELDKAISEYKTIYPNYCRWSDQKSARVAVRFLPHLAYYLEKMKKEGETPFLTTPFHPSELHAASLDVQERPLSDLWLFISVTEKIVQKDMKERPALAPALEEKEGNFLPPRWSQEFGPFLAKVGKEGSSGYETILRESVYNAQSDLGSELVIERAQELMNTFQGKK